MPRSVSRGRVPALLAIIAVVASACASPTSLDDDPLTLGVLPDEAPERLIQRYSSVVERLESDLGRDVELVIPSDYADFVGRFEAGDIDVGHFGGVTFVMARARAGAEAMVMRDVDARFTTVFVARTADSRATMSDFAGATLGFGSELSTSGHLMPRFYFQEQYGAQPEDHFGEVHFSGAHDSTLRWVADGTVDIGALNSAIYRQLISDGTVDPDAVRVVYETPIYVDYVFAAHPGLSEASRTIVETTLLELSTVDDADRAILEDLRAARFMYASSQAWDDLERISRELGILE